MSMIFSKAQMYKGHIQTKIPGRFSKMLVEKYPRLEERGHTHPYLG